MDNNNNSNSNNINTKINEATLNRPSLDSNIDQQIAAILVVGFHHAYGPIVEFCYPPLPQQTQTDQKNLEKLDLPEEWNFLPFLALPGYYFFLKKNRTIEKYKKRKDNKNIIKQQQ